MPLPGTGDTLLAPLRAAAEHAPEGEAGDRERTLLRALAEGRLADVAAVRREAQDGRDCGPLVVLLAETDARARTVAIDVAEVQAVVDRVEQELPFSSRLRFWAHAILAERLLLDFDAAAFLVARQALGALDRCDLPVLPSLALRYARARLRRVESLTWLMVPIPLSSPLDRHACRDRRDEAIADLLACGFLDEVHLTRGLTAGAAGLMCDEDIVENYSLVRDARAALRDDVRSIWPSCLDAFVGCLAFEVGDLDVTVAAFERIEEAPHRHRRFDVVTAYGRALFRLVTSGASAPNVAGIERALADVRRHDPRVAQGWYGRAAETLADMASPGCAHFARLEAELPPLTPMGAIRRQVLRLRVTAVRGAPVSTDEAIRLLEQLEAVGRRRTAARQALRLGHDLARAGTTAAAQRVHAWGLDRVPAGARATLWERWWSRPPGATGRMPTGRPASWTSPSGRARQVDGRVPANQVHRTGLELRVMAPAMELIVDGMVVAVGASQAKLLLALAVSHPAPLHVEQATDLLWPDDPLSTTRNRLTSLVHRLRRSLGHQGDAVVRTGDLLTLDAARWEVDLWRLRPPAPPAAPAPRAQAVPAVRTDAPAAPGSGLAGTPGVVATGRRRHLQALAGVRGNLCDAQFPYEEVFVDARHRLCGAWLRHARQAVAAGELLPADLEEALAALDLVPNDLQP